MSPSRRTRGRLEWLLAALVAFACTTEPAPLDKTSDEALNKAMFQGEWYYKVTVTDTEWHNTVNFIGEETQTYAGVAYKIRWEVTQDRLNGYMVPNQYLDPKGKPVTNLIGKESLALSFPIEQHFDIKYLENNTTREELNVIVENTDRPWNEREYMVVDWSQNLAASYWVPLGAESASGEIVREPVATWKNVEFIDTKNEIIDTKKWHPEESADVYVMNIDIQEQIHGALAASWYKYYDDLSMEPALVKYRISLLKKNPRGMAARQYEPLQYRDEFFKRFGFFRTEYATYDEDRGPLESQKQYLANRFDVGCHQDPSTKENVCKTIDFYMSPTMQEHLNRLEQLEAAGEGKDYTAADLRSWTQSVVDNWNQVLREATGRTDDVVVLHENEPRRATDGTPIVDADGTPRYKYELGDIRYNFINYVTKPNSSSPLGYGPSTPDPDTGETINATVNIYGNWLDYVVTRSMDLYDVIAGNCTLGEIAQGHYWDEASGACDGGTSGANNDASMKQIDGLSQYGAKKIDLNFMNSALQTAYWPKARRDAPAPKFDRVAHEAKRPLAFQLFEQREQELNTADMGKFGIIKGTKFESMMVPEATFGSTFPGAETVDDVIASFSPANRLSESSLLEMKHLEEEHGKHCRLEPAHFESNIIAFVEEMKDKPRAEVQKELRRWVYYTTTLHEMGHTIGLRHNFKGSVDQENFPEEYHAEYDAYWSKIESLKSQYEADIMAGDPAAYKAYTEAVNNIPSAHERYATTSIMDYNGDYEGWLEMPSYDRAALNFAYGNKVEVLDPVLGKWEFKPYQDGDFDVPNPFDKAGPSLPEAAASGRTVRYYQFCSDEKTSDDAFCSRFDRGVTATEIIKNFIKDQERGYFFNNFKRDREEFEDRGYWRKWFKYYDAAKVFAQLSLNPIWYDAFWGSIWDGFGAIAENKPETRDMVPGYYATGGEDLTRASMILYYYLMYDVIGRPDSGTYKLSTDVTGKKYWESTDPEYVGDDDVSAVVEPGVGQGWSDVWDSQLDTTIYDEKLMHMGVEINKIIAYEILSLPCVFNTYLQHEKANGATFWNSIWNGDGKQLWKVTRSFITGNYAHNQNPYCMDESGQVTVSPIDPLEAVTENGLVETTNYVVPETRCPEGSYPLQPGMDDLYAIYPMFYGLSGSQHPWYHNQLSDYMDSQVKGGNHRFDIPEGAEYAEFRNSTGTKTYQAVQTDDELSISYQLVVKARDISNRIRYFQACENGEELPTAEPDLQGTYGRTCEEIHNCLKVEAPDFCAAEGWDYMYIIGWPSAIWRDVDRVEAMLIMMQDMIDLAGHYAWSTPGYLEEP